MGGGKWATFCILSPTGRVLEGPSPGNEAPLLDDTLVIHVLLDDEASTGIHVLSGRIEEQALFPVWPSW